MIVRMVTCGAAALWACLACEAPEGSEGSTTDIETTTGTTTTGELEQGAPCAVEGERRCGVNGDRIYTCESAQWASQTCRSVCKALQEPSCSLGCEQRLAV